MRNPAAPFLTTFSDKRILSENLDFLIRLCYQKKLSENGLSEMAVFDLIRSGFFGVYQKWPFLKTIFYLIRSGLSLYLSITLFYSKLIPV